MKKELSKHKLGTLDGLVRPEIETAGVVPSEWADWEVRVSKDAPVGPVHSASKRSCIAERLQRPSFLNSELGNCM